jgi:hypothetical protein
MWYSSWAIIFTDSRSSSMKMFNFFPFLSFNMFLYRLNSLINWDTNYSNFVSPLLAIVFKHLLIMSHWSLTRWAPCCPEINQQNLPRHMCNLSRFLSPNIHNICYLLEAWSYWYFNLSLEDCCLRINTSKYQSSTLFKCFKFWTLVRWHISIN